MPHSLTLISFGRLDPEKGIQHLLAAITHAANNNLPLHCHIFGTGAYQKHVEQLAHDHPDYVTYHGRTSFDTIKTHLTQADYCLMPSIFLETFGLTALESLTHGVPVIGPKQGGMAPFVHPDLALDPQDMTTSLINTITTLTSKIEHNYQNRALTTAANYTTDQRLTQFYATNPIPPKRVLLVSDYQTKLGGIETYLYKVRTLLENQGIEVRIIGANLPHKNHRSKRLLFLPSACNLPFVYKLRCIIKQRSPDLVRYHSVLRHIGRAGLLHPPHRDYRTRLMFHDLGYLYPFPQRVTSEAMLATDTSLLTFLRQGRTGLSYRAKIGRTLPLIAKWLSFQFLRQAVKHSIDQCLVPADFMLTPLQQQGRGQAKVLPHFIEQ